MKSIEYLILNINTIMKISKYFLNPNSGTYLAISNGVTQRNFD